MVGCPRWNEVGFVQFCPTELCAWTFLKSIRISHCQEDLEENTGGDLTEVASGAEAETEGVSGAVEEASVAATAPGRWMPGKILTCWNTFWWL